MYTKTNWVDNTTPIDKTNLNKIEQGIYDNSIRIVKSPRRNEMKWMKICNVKYSSHVQGDFFHLKLFIGQGNNGRPNQNAYLDIICQLASTSNNDGISGCVAKLNSFLTSFTIDNTNIKIIANSNIDYDVWFYTSASQYCFPNYIADGSNLVTVTPKFELSDTEPTGTECNLEYLEIVDANKPVNISSLLTSNAGTKGIDTSFKVGKVVTINCIVNSVNFSNGTDWVDVLEIDSSILPTNQLYPHIFLPYNNAKLSSAYITTNGVVKVRTTAEITSTSVQIAVTYRTS